MTTANNDRGRGEWCAPAISIFCLYNRGYRIQYHHLRREEGGDEGGAAMEESKAARGETQNDDDDAR